MGADKRAHTAPLFDHLKILNVQQIYIYFTQLFMYKYTRNLLPAIFDDFYIYNNSVHSYNTRQCTRLHVPVARTDMRNRTIRFKGVTILNYFSTVIEQNCSIYTYKRNLKRYILSSAVAELIYGQH